MELAGACPPRYGNIETRGLSYLMHRDREVSPTRKQDRKEAPTGKN